MKIRNQFFKRNKIFFSLFFLIITISTLIILFLQIQNSKFDLNESFKNKKFVPKYYINSLNNQIINFNDSSNFDKTIVPNTNPLESSINIPNSSDLIIEYKVSYKSATINFINNMGGRIKRIYRYSNQMAIYIPIENLTLLKEYKGLIRVTKDRLFRAFLQSSVPIIKPTATWAQIETYFGCAINGSGVRVAVLDTGINGTHWDFWPRVIHNVSYVIGESWADLNGHGSHVAGIIAGNGNRSFGQNVGVAPRAYLMNFKVLNKDGAGFESDILAALEDCVSNATDIINLSLGTYESSNGTDPYSEKVRWVVEQGIPVITVSGVNHIGNYNISIPGTCPTAITVGATTDLDVIYSPQSNGPTLPPSYDVKPDLLAPGDHITSVYKNGTPGEYYIEGSGTSMACAHVSGMIALIKQVHPTWSPKMIKDALMNNALNLNKDVFSQGAGRIQGPQSINTTVIVNGSINFGLVGSNRSRTSFLTIINLDTTAKSLIISHSNPNYQTIPFINLPASTRITIPINLSFNSFNNYHNYDFLKLDFGINSIHSVISSICPNITLNYPNKIKYNQISNFNGSLIIDNATTFNYTGYKAKLYLNSILSKEQFLNSSGYFNLNYSSFLRGNYNVSIAIYDQYNNFIHQNDKILKAEGNDVDIFSFGITEQEKIGFIYLEFSNLDVGNAVVDIFTLTHAWVRYTVKVIDGRAIFYTLGVLPVGSYPIRIEFNGSLKANPASDNSFLFIIPNNEKDTQTRNNLIIFGVPIVAFAIISIAVILEKRKPKILKIKKTKKVIEETKDEGEVREIIEFARLHYDNKLIQLSCFRKLFDKAKEMREKKDPFNKKIFREIIYHFNFYSKNISMNDPQVYTTAQFKELWEIKMFSYLYIGNTERAQKLMKKLIDFCKDSKDPEYKKWQQIYKDYFSSDYIQEDHLVSEQLKKSTENEVRENTLLFGDEKSIINNYQEILFEIMGLIKTRERNKLINERISKKIIQIYENWKKEYNINFKQLSKIQYNDLCKILCWSYININKLKNAREIARDAIDYFRKRKEKDNILFWKNGIYLISLIIKSKHNKR